LPPGAQPEGQAGEQSIGKAARHPQPFEFSEENRGAQRRIRTTDTRIFNPLLYQLSYLGLRDRFEKPIRDPSAVPTKARGL
jgi:hypothetical protein